MSKSPRPNGYYFNPSCEDEVSSRSTCFTPPLSIQLFEKSLEVLPVWQTQPNDFTLVRSAPFQEWQEWLRGLPISLGRLITWQEALSEPFLSLPKKGLFPWGWSPAFLHRARNLLPSFDKQSVDWLSNASWEKLYSRDHSLRFLKRLKECGCFSCEEVNSSIMGVTIYGLAELKEKCHQWQRPVLVKPRYSSSGRGQILLPDKRALSLPIQNRLQKLLLRDVFFVAEPLLDKQQDFSFQFEVVQSGAVHFLGFSLFETSPQHTYLRSLLNCPLPKWHSNGENLHQFAEWLRLELQNSFFASEYRGFIGVDAMLYNNDRGKLCLQPVVEINCRQTMGHLALCLERLILPGKQGFFTLLPLSKARKYLKKMPHWEGGFLAKGTLPLTPISIQSTHVALLGVASAS